MDNHSRRIPTLQSFTYSDYSWAILDINDIKRSTLGRFIARGYVYAMTKL